MRLGTLLLLTVAVAGCSNRYADTFTASNYRETFSPVKETKVINVGHSDPGEIYRRDFASARLVGTSTWVGNEVAGDDCKAHAKKVGADVVLWRKQPHSTGTYTYNLTVPDTRTTYHRGDGAYRGNTGYGNFNYRGSSTSYGTRTTLHRGHVLFHQFDAVFLRTSP